MKPPTDLHVRAPGAHRVIKTVEQALGFIERDLPPEVAKLPRWTFARALLLEAQKTGKSRDITAAFRQLRQALHNERWLADEQGIVP